MDVLALFQWQLIIKLFIFVLVVFYFIFAVVVYKQVQLMTRVLDSQVSATMRLVALIQIIAVAIGGMLAVVLV